MQDIYGPERDYGDICDEAYDKWKQEDIECKAARRPRRSIRRVPPRLRVRRRGARSVPGG